ncbi:hypothetical protein SH580_11100 [Coraliomargarita algicola]|uniref:Outer membrane lipoprotein-sorting protein n=1 Tax=Coraliomargarita algicola TaxID=3092156 RepID=A0ABZ0RM24_9BACT|nr:hypothetical protein [Coraliomargarita sp. J2-16]WPJ93979.1 hypothetical protein SH580_11100 [Coraliomargarita sp. J2-16]
MGSSYTNTKRKGGKPTQIQRLSKQALYLGAILLVCAAIYTAIKSIGNSDQSDASTQFPHGTIRELTSLRAFMPAYLSVNCKEPLLESIRTIRIAGTVESDGNSENFVLVKMRPDRMLFNLDRVTHEITYGIIGPEVWERIRIPKKDDIHTMIEGEAAEAWRAQSHFFDRIIEAHLGKGIITGIEAADWNGNDCLKVHITDANEKRVETFIDPFTMYPIAERQILSNGSIQQSEFFDYHDVDGIPIPFHIIASVNNTITTRTRIERAAINTGIMSRLFEVPDSLR